MKELSGARGLLVIAVLLLVSACTHQVPISARIEADNYAVEKLPLAGALYISAQTSSYIHEQTLYGDSWVFPLGTASGPLWASAMKIAFDSSRQVDSLPPYDEAEDRPLAVIEPRIESFFVTIPMLKTSVYRAEIEYSITLYDSTGLPAVTWRVRGKGAKKGQIGFEVARWPGEAAALALEEAVGNFIYGLKDVPEFRRWLRAQDLLS